MPELLLSLCSGDLSRYIAVGGGTQAGTAVVALPDLELGFAGLAGGEGETLVVENGPDAVEVAWTSVGEGLSFSLNDEAEAVAQPVEANVAVDRGGTRTEAELAGMIWSLPDRGGGSYRTAWAALEGGALVIFLAWRPPGGQHGEESAACARFSPDGEVLVYEEALVSTEYDPGGTHRRATFELWRADEEGIADRGGGLRVRGGRAEGAAGRTETAAFSWTFGGRPGFGGYEILSG